MSFTHLLSTGDGGRGWGGEATEESACPLIVRTGRDTQRNHCGTIGKLEFMGNPATSGTDREDVTEVVIFK